MRVYTVVSSAALLVISVLGFISPDFFHLPSYLLAISFILGAWGAILIFRQRKR